MNLSTVIFQKVADELIFRQTETTHRWIEEFLRMLHNEYGYGYSSGGPYKKGEAKPKPYSGSGVGFF